MCSIFLEIANCFQKWLYQFISNSYYSTSSHTFNFNFSILTHLESTFTFHTEEIKYNFMYLRVMYASSSVKFLFITLTCSSFELSPIFLLIFRGFTESQSFVIHTVANYLVSIHGLCFYFLYDIFNVLKFL